MHAPAVRFAKTPDGYSIAYAVTGNGPPLVLTPHAFSHIQLYWQETTFWTAWLVGLAARFRLVQLDWRGQGLSSRGLSVDYSPVDLVADLEAVTDRLGLDRFVLVGVGGPAHASIRYAARHPARVAALVLFSFTTEPGAWSLGMFRALPAENWDVFLESQVPHGLSVEETHRSLSRLRRTVEQKDWLIRTRTDQNERMDEALAAITAPTLVVHPRDYRMPSEEACRKLAARIPGAIFASIPGRSILGDAEAGLALLDAFLSDLDPAHRAEHRVEPSHAPNLSVRQMEVLRLVAAGKTNREIAEELVLSERTVQRHIADIYTRIAVRNRAEATAYAFTLRR